jgi:hypothetical protein
MQERIPKSYSRTEPNKELEESPDATTGKDCQCHVVLKFAKVWQFQNQSVLSSCFAQNSFSKKKDTQRLCDTSHKTGKHVDDRQPSQAASGQTLKANLATVLTPSHKRLPFTPELDMPCVQSQTPLTAGTNQLQKKKAIAVPVTRAARKPARDLHSAKGRPRIGMRAGSGGVLEPHRRSRAEAAVSAQECVLGEKVKMRHVRN